MAARWKIWYDDGTTFSSADGPPEAAPTDGVLLVGDGPQGSAKGAQLYWGPDYYFWTGDGWAAGSLADLERWLRKAMPHLKFGRWTRADTYHNTKEKAKREWLGG